MKKGFKRFLSGALATVMAVAGMTIGMATTAMADDVLWVYEEDTNLENIPEVFGLEMDTNPATFSTTNSKASGSFATNIFDGRTSGLFKGKTGLDPNSFKSITCISDSGRAFAITPAEDGSVKLYVVRPEQTSESEKSIRVYAEATKTGNYTYEVSSKNDYTGYNVAAGNEENIAPIEIPVKKDTSYIVYFNNSKTPVYAIGFDYAIKGEASISGSVSGFETAPIGKFYCNDNQFTLDDNYSFEISELLDGNYTLTYDGMDYSMDPVNVTISNQESVSDKALTLTKKIAKTIDGPVDEIRFTDKLGTTAPDGTEVPKDGLAIPEGYVFLDYFTSYGVLQRENANYGIQVQDFDTRSFEFTTTVPLKLIIGYSSTGSSNTSDIAVKAVGAADDAIYSTVEGSEYKTPEQLVINYLPAGTYRVYSPAEVAARDARVHTIEFAEPEKTNITDAAETTPAVLQNGTDFYVVSVVTQDEVDSYSNLAQKTTQEELASSETVYRAIQAGGLTYTASDFGGTADDFLFASIIDSQGAEADTVLSSIQNNVTTVLSNE